MNRAHRFLAFLPVALAALALLGTPLAGFAAGKEKERTNPAHAFAKLRPGMTPEEVHKIVGAPKLISRQILYHRYREQWLYQWAVPLRLTFDCRRGQIPQLLYVPMLPIDNREERGRQKEG